jgi:hypothetical protein
MRLAALQGALKGLGPMCVIYSNAMEQDPAHGNITGATHANYAAYPVFAELGVTGQSTLNAQVNVVEALNPGTSETEPLALPDKAIGVILSSATDYQYKLETENAGQKAVLGPTIAGAGNDFTRAASQGIKDALQ